MRVYGRRLWGANVPDDYVEVPAEALLGKQHDMRGCTCILAGVVVLEVEPKGLRGPGWLRPKGLGMTRPARSGLEFRSLLGVAQPACETVHRIGPAVRVRALESPHSGRRGVGQASRDPFDQVGDVEHLPDLDRQSDDGGLQRLGVRQGEAFGAHPAIGFEAGELLFQFGDFRPQDCSFVLFHRHGSSSKCSQNIPAILNGQFPRLAPFPIRPLAAAH